MKLPNEIKEKIEEFLKKHGIKKASVFGSYARGDATLDSDIDLLVEFPEETSLLDHVGMQIELSEILNKKIDLHSLNGLSPYIKDSILQEAIVIYE